MSTDIRSQEDLNKFVAEARTALADVKTESERVGKIETMAKQLSAGLDDLKRAQAEQSVYVPHGSDSDVVRQYAAPSASREQIKGGVVDLRSETKGQLTETRRWAGGEAGVVRMLGGMEDGFYEYGLLDDPAPKNEWQAELQEKTNAAGMVRALRGKHGAEHPQFRAMQRGIVRHLQRGPAAIAKMFAANTGEGGDWIVTLPLSTLERTAEIPRIIESQFQDLPITAKSVQLPFLTSGVQAFQHGVPTSGDLNPAQYAKSVPTTDYRTLTAPTLAVNIPIENDAIEDVTIFDVLPLLQQLGGEAMVDAREDAYINGDTTASHQDTGLASWSPNSRWPILGAPNDHRRSMMGLRARAVDVSNAEDQSGTQTVAGYMAKKATLTSPHGVLDTFWITSPAHYLAKIIVDTNVLTVDKFGPNATVHTGQVASIGGSPLFLSQFMTEDLNASGVFDNSVTTYTGLLLVSRSRFRNARRRSMRVAVEVVEREGVTYIVLSERAGLVTIDPATTVKNVWYGYKLAKT